jgi:hypothetical protein
LTIRELWSALLKVSNKYVSGGISKRKKHILSRLPLRYSYGAGLPVDVIQSERNHFAGSKPIGGNKEKHCIITQTVRVRRVDGRKELSYGLP